MPIVVSIAVQRVATRLKRHSMMLVNLAHQIVRPSIHSLRPLAPRLAALVDTAVAEASERHLFVHGRAETPGTAQAQLPERHTNEGSKAAGAGHDGFLRHRSPTRFLRTRSWRC